MDSDWYRLLGVPRSATDAQIRQAYRDLAWRLHPDRAQLLGDGERVLAERRMREVNEAWAVLGDPVGRATYDRSIGNADHQTRPQASESPGSGRSEFRDAKEAAWAHWWGLDPSDIDELAENDVARRSVHMGRSSALRDDPLPPPTLGHWLAKYGLVGAILGVLVAIVVFTGAFGLTSKPSDGGVSQLTGDCVLGITLVDCSQPHDAAIVGMPDADGQCPDGTMVLRLARNVCVIEDN